jgi:hypothetical protein
MENILMFIQSEPILIFMAGMAGALVAQILKGNSIELPKKIDGKMSLGCLGGIILGGTAGYFVDGSPQTAFIAGFAGKEFIEKLLNKGLTNSQKLAEAQQVLDEDDAEAQQVVDEEEKELEPDFSDIETMIRWKADRAGVDANLAVNVAKAESGLRPNAINVNTGGSTDRGLYQWNDKYHPEVTDAMAYDPEIATDLFLKAVKENHLSWWKASKKCWDKKNEYPNI